MLRRFSSSSSSSSIILSISSSCYFHHHHHLRFQSSSSPTPAPAPLTNENAAEVLSRKAYIALKQHRVSHCVSYLDECGRRYLVSSSSSKEVKKDSNNKTRTLNHSSKKDNSSEEEHYDQLRNHQNFSSIEQKKKWESVVALWLAMMHLSALRDHEKGISFRQVAASFRAQQDLEQSRNHQNDSSSSSASLLNSFGKNTNTNSNNSNSNSQENNKSTASSQSERSASSASIMMATSGVIQFKVSLCADAVLRGLLRKLQKSANLTYGHNHGLWHAFRNVPFLSYYTSSDHDETNSNNKHSNKHTEEDFILSDLKNLSGDKSFSSSSSSSSSFDSSPLYTQALRVRLLYRALVDAGIAIAPDLVHHVNSFLPPLLSEVSTSSTTSVMMARETTSESSGHRRSRHHHSNMKNNKSNMRGSSSLSATTLEEAALLSAEEHQELLEKQRSEKIQQRKEEIEEQRRFEEELEFQRAGCEAFVSSKKTSTRELLFCEVSSNNAVNNVFGNSSNHEDNVLKMMSAKDLDDKKSTNDDTDENNNTSLSFATSQFIERPAWWNVMRENCVQTVVDSFLLLKRAGGSSRTTEERRKELVSSILSSINDDQQNKATFADSLRNIPLNDLKIFARAASHLKHASTEQPFDWKELKMNFLSDDLLKLKENNNNNNTPLSFVSKLLLLHHSAPLISELSPITIRKRNHVLQQEMSSSSMFNKSEEGKIMMTFSNQFALEALLTIITGNLKSKQVISFIKSKQKRTPEQEALLICVFKIPQLTKMIRQVTVAMSSSSRSKNTNTEILEQRKVQLERNICEVVDLVNKITAETFFSSTNKQKNDTKVKSNSKEDDFSFKIESGEVSLKESRRVFESFLFSTLVTSLASRTIRSFIFNNRNNNRNNHVLPVVSQIKIINRYRDHLQNETISTSPETAAFLKAQSQAAIESLLINQQNNNNNEEKMKLISEMIAKKNEAPSLLVKISYLSHLASQFMKLQNNSSNHSVNDPSSSRFHMLKIVDDFFNVFMVDSSYCSESEIKKFTRLVLCKTSTHWSDEQSGNKIFLFSFLKICSKRKAQMLFGADDDEQQNNTNMIIPFKSCLALIPNRYKIKINSDDEKQQFADHFGAYTWEKMNASNLVINSNNTEKKTVQVITQRQGTTDKLQQQEQIHQHHQSHHHLRTEFAQAKKYHAKLSWLAALRALSSSLSSSKSSLEQNNDNQQQRLSKKIQIAMESCKSEGRVHEASKILQLISSSSASSSSPALQVNAMVALETIEKGKKYDEIRKFIERHFPELLSVSSSSLSSEDYLLRDLPLLRLTIDALVKTSSSNNNNNKQILIQLFGRIASAISGSNSIQNTKEVSLRGLLPLSSSSSTEGRKKEIIETFPSSLVPSFKFKKAVANAILKFAMEEIQEISMFHEKSPKHSSPPSYPLLRLIFCDDTTELKSQQHQQQQRHQFSSAMIIKSFFHQCASLEIPYYTDLAPSDKMKLRQSMELSFFAANDIVRVIASLGSTLMINEARKKDEDGLVTAKNTRSLIRIATSTSNTVEGDESDQCVLLLDLTSIVISLYDRLKECQNKHGFNYYNKSTKSSNNDDEHSEEHHPHENNNKKSGSPPVFSSAIEPRTTVMVLQNLNLAQKWEKSIEIIEEHEILWNNSTTKQFSSKDDYKNFIRQKSDQALKREEDINTLLHRAALALVGRMNNTNSIADENKSALMMNFDDENTLESRVLKAMQLRDLEHWPSCVELMKIKIGL